MAKTEPTVEPVEPQEGFATGGIVPADAASITLVAGEEVLTLAEYEARNYARAHQPSPIKEE